MRIGLMIPLCCIMLGARANVVSGSLTYCPVPATPNTFDVTVDIYGYSPMYLSCDSILMVFEDTAVGYAFAIGQCDSITTTSCGSEIWNATYTARHTYPGPGTYVVRAEIPNRPAGALNINNGNSVNTTWYVSATIVIDPFLGSVCSPRPSAPFIFEACADFCTYYNPNPAVDTTSVGLSTWVQYSIIPCFGTGGQPLSTYVFPDQVQPGPGNVVSVDTAGTVGWCQPPIPGKYAFCLLMERYVTVSSIDYFMGSTVVDYTICINACTGVDDIAKSSPTFALHPNPTTGVVRLDGQWTMDKGVEVMDISGRVVGNYELTTNNSELDLSSLPNGIYFMRVGEHTHKVVLNH